MTAGGKVVSPPTRPASGDPGSRPLRRRLSLPEQTLVRHVALAAAFGFLLYLLSESFGPFNNLRLATAAYYFVALAGLTILTGLNGQISLGHGALMAVGAYAAALLITRQHWALVPVLAAATVVGALAGIVVGAVAARLRGPYLAGATLAFAVGLPSLADRYPGAFGGQNGIDVPPPTPPTSLGQTFPLERWQAWIACLGALVVFVVLANLTRSRLGRSFRAVRDDEVAAQLAGLNVARTQVLAFVVSAACAGLAGALFVVVTSLAAPGAFTLSLSLALLTGVVLGGLGSLAGAVWGAIVLVMLPSWTNDLSDSLELSGDVKGNLPLALYGVSLIVVMLGAPNGIQGAVKGVVDRMRGRLGGTRSRNREAHHGNQSTSNEEGS
jgi:branched-chain amino acid transport system permease protein